LKTARNVAVTVGALFLSVLAIQPFLWLNDSPEGHSYGAGIAGLVKAHLIGALPYFVAAVVFGLTAGLGIATRNSARAALLVGLSIAVLVALSHRYVAPEFAAWVFTLTEIAVSGVLAWAAFVVVRMRRTSGETPANSG